MSDINKISNPIETIIDFAWAAGADRFWVNNAKDELKKLRKIIEEYESVNIIPIAWAKINDREDLYDLRLQNNPYDDQCKVIPLYRIKYE